MQRGTQRRLSSRTWLAAAVAAAVALAGASAGAQQAGTVQGTVTLVGDIGPVHGALVLVVGTGATALTEEDGTYVLENVPAGAYEVLAQREHLTAGRQMITVVAGEAVTVDFELAPSPVHEQVTVTAAAGGTETTFEAFNAVTTLDSFDLIQAGQNSLGDALQNEPGIAVRSFGPGSSRPIIRGFDGDRVLILDDGIRTGDLSSQSGDHGVTIDPNGAERIEIVRGPATLLYGSNAVGGLVNIISPHEAMHESMFEGTRAQISTDAGSANAQAGISANLQHSEGALRLWAGGSTRRTGDYDTPEGTIANSATELSNARAGVGYDNGTFFASGGFTFEQGRYGVPFADEFHGAHDVHDAHDAHDAGHGDEDDPHEGEEEGLEIDLTSRRQVGRFDLGVRNLSNRLIDGLRVTMNVIDWGHDELEVENGFENVGTSFDNRTYIVRAEFDQQQTERLSGRFGAWTQVRDFQATGFEALAPRTDLTSMAAFAYEEVNFGPVRLQFGGRVERNSYRAGDRMIGFDSEDRDDHGEDDHGEDDHDEDDHDEDDHDEDDHDEDDHDEDDHDEDDHDEDDHDEDDHDDDHDEDDHDDDHDEDDHDDDHDEDDHDDDHDEDDHDDDHDEDDHDDDHGEDDHDDDHGEDDHDDDHGEDDHDDDHGEDDHDDDHGEDDHDDDHGEDDQTTTTTRTTTTTTTTRTTTTTTTTRTTTTRTITTTTRTRSSSRFPTRAIGRSWALPGQSACTWISASGARSWPTSPARTARRRWRSSTTTARTWGISRSRWATRTCAPRRRWASTSASAPAATACAAS